MYLEKRNKVDTPLGTRVSTLSLFSRDIRTHIVSPLYIHRYERCLPFSHTYVSTLSLFFLFPYIRICVVSHFSHIYVNPLSFSFFKRIRSQIVPPLNLHTYLRCLSFSTYICISTLSLIVTCIPSTLSFIFTYIRIHFVLFLFWVPIYTYLRCLSFVTYIPESTFFLIFQMHTFLNCLFFQHVYVCGGFDR